jgi:DNA-binding XRE family transcriptional regulator
VTHHLPSLPPGPSLGVRQAFSTAFARWRKEKGFPLKQVAADLGVSISTVNAWERGERFPTGHHIELIVIHTALAPCRLFCVGSNLCSLTIHDDPLANPNGCP